MRFKLWCIEHGYTAKQVAELTGSSLASIYSYWQGKRKPTRSTEKQLKAALNIPSGLFDD